MSERPDPAAHDHAMAAQIKLSTTELRDEEEWEREKADTANDALLELQARQPSTDLRNNDAFQSEATIRDKHIATANTLADRARQVIGIIEDNPARVVADAEKPPLQRSEYDPNRAHVIAIATNSEETLLAQHRAKGKTNHHTEEAMHRRDREARHAGQQYDLDPLEFVPQARPAKKPLWKRLLGQ